MAWALDQAWTGNGPPGSGSTVTLTYGGAVAAGALLVCFVNNASSETADSCSDSVNGAWTQFGQGSPIVEASQSFRGSAWYFLNSAAGTPTITVTFSAASARRAIVAGSYTGIATSGAFDVGAGQAQTNPGTGADAVSSTATGTIAQTNSLAISLATESAVPTFTANGSWTQRYNAATGSTWRQGVQDQNIASLVTVTGTWTTNSSTADTVSIVGVFKEPASATAKQLAALGVG